MVIKECYGCEKNDAVMDLIFGEFAEVYRIPWCAHCICPDTWNAATFHHAESYTQDWEAPAWEKDKKPQCTKCGELGRNVWCGKGYCAECFNVVSGMNKLEKKPVGVMGDLIEKATKEALSVAFKEPDTKALYSRQPHYEGGIDPITFGQDNLDPKEMNGFYKMNVIKYVARCDRKNGLEDLQKAQDYLNLLIKSYEDAADVEEEELELLKCKAKEEGRKKRLAMYKAVWHTEVEDMPLTEEMERAMQEAELCVDRFHAGLEVRIKRQDVLDVVTERLRGCGYTLLMYGDGTTFIEKNEER